MTTGYDKVFIDTAPFIYFIEKDENNPRYFDKVKRFLMDGYKDGVQFVTSVITIEEYMVFPYRSNQLQYIELFERLLKSLKVDVISIDREIAKKAAQIRAAYKTFKAMDSLQLAASCLSGCELFLTNDKQLIQFKEQKCMLIDEMG